MEALGVRGVAGGLAPAHPDDMLEKTPHNNLWETVSFEEHAGTRVSKQGPTMTDGVWECVGGW